MIPTARGARARSVLARRRAPSRVFPRLFPARARALGSSERDADADADADTQARGSGVARSTSGRSRAPAVVRFRRRRGPALDAPSVKGALRPGEVLNTDPTSDAGALARPVSNETDPSPMLVARFFFDLVHGETLEPLPLDRLYNHLLRDLRPPERGEKKTKNKNALYRARADWHAPGSLTTAAAASAAVAVLAANLTAANLSAVLAPCGVGSFFAGGGAEWRGLHDREREKRGVRRNPRGDAARTGGARVDRPAGRRVGRQPRDRPARHGRSGTACSARGAAVTRSASGTPRAESTKLGLTRGASSAAATARAGRFVWETTL